MAAKKILTSLDLAGNELQNAVLQNLASAPSAPSPGRFYFDTTTGRFKFRSASVWVDPTDRTAHTGTQLAATISDFDTQVRTSRLDQLAAPTSALSMNNQRLTNVADGVSASDAATYGQLQGIANGRQFKDPVRVATTANITLSGLQTIDSVTLAAGDRVLVKNQTTASQNGIWVVASGAWVRATDADSLTPDSEVKAGMSVMVSEGATAADKQFTLTTDGPITLGTTSLTFAQTGAGTAFVQGTGITISGNTVSVDTAVVVRKFSQAIGDGSATSITVTHSLNTLDVQVQLYEVATGATVECDVTRGSVNQVTLGFALAPSVGQYRVVVFG